MDPSLSVLKNLFVGIIHHKNSQSSYLSGFRVTLKIVGYTVRK